VLARSPEKLGGLAARVVVVGGDALDRNALASALVGRDAVLYTLGAGFVRTTTLFSESTRVLLDQMKVQRVRRLLCVTGVGAGDTKGHGGLVYDRILHPLFTRHIYRDKDRQEQLIMASDTDWTLVRPAVFRGRAAAGPMRVVTRVEGVVLRRISPREVATFLLDEVEQNRYVRKAVFIGHE
jgi:putative NADH-flavin reductase